MTKATQKRGGTTTYSTGETKGPEQGERGTIATINLAKNTIDTGLDVGPPFLGLQKFSRFAEKGFFLKNKNGMGNNKQGVVKWVVSLSSSICLSSYPTTKPTHVFTVPSNKKVQYTYHHQNKPTSLICHNDKSAKWVFDCGVINTISFDSSDILKASVLTKTHIQTKVEKESM